MAYFTNTPSNSGKLEDSIIPKPSTPSNKANGIPLPKILFSPVQSSARQLSFSQKTKIATYMDKMTQSENVCYIE